MAKIENFEYRHISNTKKFMNVDLLNRYTMEQLSIIAEGIKNDNQISDSDKKNLRTHISKYITRRYVSINLASMKKDNLDDLKKQVKEDQMLTGEDKEKILKIVRRQHNETMRSTNQQRAIERENQKIKQKQPERVQTKEVEQKEKDKNEDSPKILNNKIEFTKKQKDEIESEFLSGKDFRNFSFSKWAEEEVKVNQQIKKIEKELENCLDQDRINQLKIEKAKCKYQLKVCLRIGEKQLDKEIIEEEEEKAKQETIKKIKQEVDPKESSEDFIEAINNNIITNEEEESFEDIIKAKNNDITANEEEKSFEDIIKAKNNDITVYEEEESLENFIKEMNKKEAERKTMEEIKQEVCETAERIAVEEAEKIAKNQAKGGLGEETEEKAKDPANGETGESADKKKKEEIAKKIKEEVERKIKEEEERKIREEVAKKAKQQSEKNEEEAKSSKGFFKKIKEKISKGWKKIVAPVLAALAISGGTQAKLNAPVQNQEKTTVTELNKSIGPKQFEETENNKKSNWFREKLKVEEQTEKRCTLGDIVYIEEGCNYYENSLEGGIHNTIDTKNQWRPAGEYMIDGLAVTYKDANDNWKVAKLKDDNSNGGNYGNLGINSDEYIKAVMEQNGLTHDQIRIMYHINQGNIQGEHPTGWIEAPKNGFELQTKYEKSEGQEKEIER